MCDEMLNGKVTKIILSINDRLNESFLFWERISMIFVIVIFVEVCTLYDFK